MIGVGVLLFFFKHKTAYEMRISDWSSDVCSSDLLVRPRFVARIERIAAQHLRHAITLGFGQAVTDDDLVGARLFALVVAVNDDLVDLVGVRRRFLSGGGQSGGAAGEHRSEERRVGKECGRTCSVRGSPYH